MLNRTSLYDGQLEFADANIAGLTSMSAGKDSYRVFRMKNSKFKNWHGRQFLNRPVSCTFGESNANKRLIFSQLLIFKVEKKSHRKKKKT